VARINGLRNKVSGSYAEWKNDAEAMQAMLRELDAIVAAAVEARTIDPSLGLAWAAEAQTLAVRANLRMDLGQPADLRSARAAADQTLRRFPQLPDAHFALAMVATYEAKELASSLLPDRAQLAAKKKEVFGALAEAVRLDPTYGRAYLFRAGLYAAFGEAQEALDDLRQAQKLVPGLDPRLEASIRAMLDEAPTAPPAAHSQVTAQSHATA
jgi:Tfp pilus assembly protein PilF